MAIESVSSAGTQQVKQVQPVEKPEVNTLPEPVKPPEKAVTDAQERSQTLPQSRLKQVEGQTAIQAQESQPTSQAEVAQTLIGGRELPQGQSAPANTNIQQAPAQPPAPERQTAQTDAITTESQPRSTEARQQQAAEVEQQTQQAQDVADAYASRSPQTGADRSEEQPTLNVNA